MSKRVGGKKVAILGAGKMGAILLQSFLRGGLLKASETWATVAHAERARMLKDKLKVHSGTDNREAVRNADIVFLCVKPQVVADVVMSGEVRSAFAGCGHGALHAPGGNGPKH